MKKQIFLIIFLFLILNAYSQIQPQECYTPIGYMDISQCPEDFPYILIFEDNFEGSSLDLSKWQIQPFASGCKDGGQLQGYYSLDNVSVANGICTITAKQETVYKRVFNYCTNECQPCTTQDELDNCILDDGLPNLRAFYYTTANLWSLKSFKYSKFEIHCKIPPRDGTWPTFWLFGIASPWNEIDIFDGFYPNTETCSDLCCERIRGYNHCAKQAYRVDHINNNDTTQCGTSETYHDDDIDYSDDWHTYTLEWDEYHIVWSIDGAVTYDVESFYNGVTGQNVNCSNIINNPGLYYKKYLPNMEMNLIFNLQIPTNCPISQTFPSDFQIDYIKVWQRDNGCCISHKYYEASDNLPAVTQVDDFIVAGNDVGIENASGDVIVKSGQNVTFHAGEYIDLLPGFTVEEGANFTAETQDCAINNPGGDDIVVNNFPDEFTDKMLVSVNGATSFSILVEQTGWPFNSLYYEQNVPIYTNPVLVWDGTCNYPGNCGFYTECDKDRKVTIDFKNCDKQLSQNKTVHVNCSSAKIVNDSLADSVSIKLPNETKRDVYFTLMPNPCSYYASINYSTTQGDDVNITFFDYTGNKVKEYSFPDGVNNKIVDLSNFSDGIYSYQVYFGNNLFKTDKIVIIK